MNGPQVPDLNSLRIFAKVVEAKSFSVAARRLKIPTSTVSRKVADLEAELGVRLLERSTRNLRLTDVGAAILDLARHSVEINDSVDDVVSNHRIEATGLLRITAPPSISDSLLVPICDAFQLAHPKVSIQIFVSERNVDLIAEGFDLAFRVDAQPDETLVSRTILTYRHQLVTSPEYLKRRKAPTDPKDLLNHRLMAFSHGQTETKWEFRHPGRDIRESITFEPILSMNDFSGISKALLDGMGICDLPPIVQPLLMQDGLLVEIMPKWRFRTWDLSLEHVDNRYITRAVRLFSDFAADLAPRLFPNLPT